MSLPVGIDLGTTRSVVACVDEYGRPRILSDAEGCSLVPSVVLFDDSGPVVGEIARDSAVAMPERVVECVKRHMGDRSWRFEVDRTSYTAVDVSSIILSEMRRIAEEALGSEVRQAVVTVPAYFDNRQRLATIDAAKMAGLEVLKIVNEPTAAAMQFLADRSEQVRSALVYDLGGGTFDITYMRRDDEGALREICTYGHHWLGGKDWDARILNHVVAAFSEKYGLDPRTDPGASYDLGLRCESAKIALSTRAKTSITCQFEGKMLSVELTRDQFDQMTADLLHRTETEVDAAMSEAKISAVDIEVVLLVGGSTKMPMVATLMYNKARVVEESRNPDHCVALGAALEAARLNGQQEVYRPEARRLLVGHEVASCTPHSLGNVAIRGQELINATIIPKSTTVPCECSREDFFTSFDDQESLTVHLVQGESEDLALCVPVASYSFSGIPRRPAGSQLRLTYRYNENSVVEARAWDLKSGTELSRSSEALTNLLELQQKLKAQLEEPRLRKRPRRVALLIDASGSMGYQDMENAKDACLEFVEKTDFKSVDVGLVQFGMGKSPSIVQELCREPRKLRKAVGTLSAKGGTPMAEAVALGTNMVTSGSGDAELFLVLFTDGLPNDRNATLKAGQRAKKLGINIICVGIGAADHSLLDQLATHADQAILEASSESLVTTFGNIAQVISGQ